MNLIEAIQERCNYLREKVIPEYDAIGSTGAIGASLLRHQIVEAERTIASGDTVSMIATLTALSETCESAL